MSRRLLPSLSLLLGGRQAEISIMGPDIDLNIALFDFGAVTIPGQLAQVGQSKSSALGPARRRARFLTGALATSPFPISDP